MDAIDTVELEYRKRIDAMTIAERVHRAADSRRKRTDRTGALIEGIRDRVSD